MGGGGGGGGDDAMWQFIEQVSGLNIEVSYLS